MSTADPSSADREAFLPATLAGVTAIVTTHNARATLDVCLSSVIAAGPFAEILLIDSGSVDGCLDGIEERFPVRVYKLGRNGGPCATRNLGMREARTDHVLFLDDDMILEPDLVETLAEVLAAHPDAALAGPTIVFADRPDAIQYAGGRLHFGGLPHLLRLGERPDRSRAPEEVDVLTAGCLLADRKKVQSAGGFDEDYFFLAEDVDLSMRLRQAGHKLFVVPATVVQNIGGGHGISLNKDADYPARRVELHSRNRWLLLAKNYDRWTLFALLPALVVYEVAWLGFATLAGHLLPYLRGKVRALGVIFKMIWRGREKRHKVVPDRSLLSAPPMTFTATALAQPLAKRGARVLDGWLRLLWTILRGGLQ